LIRLSVIPFVLTLGALSPGLCFGQVQQDDYSEAETKAFLANLGRRSVAESMPLENYRAEVREFVSRNPSSPDAPRLLYFIADSYATMRDPDLPYEDHTDKALAAYEDLFSRYSEPPATILNAKVGAGQLYLKSRQLARAASLADEVIDGVIIIPNPFDEFMLTFSARILRARVESEKGDFHASREAIDAAMRMIPPADRSFGQVVETALWVKSAKLTLIGLYRLFPTREGQLSYLDEVSVLGISDQNISMLIERARSEVRGNLSDSTSASSDRASNSVGLNPQSRSSPRAPGEPTPIIESMAPSLEKGEKNSTFFPILVIAIFGCGIALAVFLKLRRS
jgi:hypothetical protein